MQSPMSKLIANITNIFEELRKLKNNIISNATNSTIPKYNENYLKKLEVTLLNNTSSLEKKIRNISLELQQIKQLKTTTTTTVKPSGTKQVTPSSIASVAPTTVQTTTSKPAGQWKEWSSWFACNQSCIQNRVRFCSSNSCLLPNGSNSNIDMASQRCPFRIAPCNDGNWGEWSSWSSCSQSCYTRKRLCDNPITGFNGINCLKMDGERGNWEIDGKQCNSTHKSLCFKICKEMGSYRSCLEFPNRADCLEHLRVGLNISGTYLVSNKLVYCDQETDGGGWIVIQRRQDGSVNFRGTWTQYKSGFRSIIGEFYLGNDNIHTFTSGNKLGYELRIELEDFIGIKKYAKYKSFKIADENNKYRLSISGYSGTAGDSMGDHNNRYFSTFYRDNDNDSGNCALLYQGGWWYNRCFRANLNGQYGKDLSGDERDCLVSL